MGRPVRAIDFPPLSSYRRDMKSALLMVLSLVAVGALVYAFMETPSARSAMSSAERFVQGNTVGVLIGVAVVIAILFVNRPRMS